jgi:Family of unknown function (DUF6519)
MRADLSRDTFDPQKQYEAVVLQQGRPLLDADFNEQAALTRHQAQASARDAVGRAAAPRDGGGFAIGLVQGGGDLTISAGRLYVDGVALDLRPQEIPAVGTSDRSLTVDSAVLDGRSLVAGDPVYVTSQTSGATAPVLATVTTVSGAVVTLSAVHSVVLGASATVSRATLLSHQPHVSSPAPDRNGRYAVVLHGRALGVSAIDDPAMADAALGGPDPSGRLRLVWQVTLARLGDVGTGDCSTWQAPVRSATLRPVLRKPTATLSDCALPPEAGFRGMVNSLYRFEVAALNPDGSVKTLLWDRDNASVATPITNLSGGTATLASFGPKGPGGFAQGQTVTTEDQDANAAGSPARIATMAMGTAPLSVTLTPAPGTIGARPRLRRWGGVIDLSTGVSSAEREVELGLYVAVSGAATVGSFWLVPARTALGGPGGLDWPAGPTEGTFAPQLPHGPAEVWTTLGLVDFDLNAGYTVLPDQQCRKVFPSLSTITADDVSYDDSEVDLGVTTVQGAIEELSRRQGGCTLVVHPGENWGKQIQALPDGAHARLCFTSGDFVSSTRVDISGKGHIVVEGIGPGTRIRTTEDEVALMFTNCASVTVSDLSVAARGRGAVAPTGLLGALTIRGSAIAVVERVLASCAPGANPLGGCITISGTADGGLIRADIGERYPGRVVVRDCTLEAGEYQVGLSVRDARQVDISGVVVSGPEAGPVDVAKLNHRLRAMLRGGVIAAITAGGKGATGVNKVRFTSAGVMSEITYRDVAFQAAGRFADPWRRTFGRGLEPDANRSTKAFLLDLADEALRLTPTERVGRLRAAIDAVVADRVPPIFQGIVVAGHSLGRVTVRDCRVTHAIQGIHIGTSREEPSRGLPVIAERVQVTGNTIDVTIPPEGARGRHGIYVGNAQSIDVSRNWVSLSTQALRDVISSRGIEVSGYVGPDVVISDNTVSRFPIGIGFLPFGDSSILLLPARWVIRWNLCANASQKTIETVYTRTSIPAILRDNMPE